MKSFSAKLLLSLGLGLLALFTSRLSAAEPTDKAEAKVVASIRPKGKYKTADLPALAHLRFEEACKVALLAAPGSIVKGELEIEHGNLMYSFEIVGADKKITEVEVDAGDGKILDVDRN